MPKPSPLPEPLAGRPFAVGEAQAAGLSPRRIRASDLQAPIRGVRAPAGERLHPVAAFLPRLAPDQFFSHVSAAQIYRMPLPRRLDAEPTVHVGVVAPAHPPRARGVSGHRFNGPLELRTVRGFRVPPPATTWCQLTDLLSDEELVVVGDHLVRRKLPLCTVAEMQAAVSNLGAARGARRIRRALELVRPRTDSPQETRLRLLLIAAGLPEPVVQHTIIDDDGYFAGTPDLAYVDAKIAIEYQGKHHQEDAAVWADDIDRRAIMKAAGWLVIEVIAAHLRHPDRLVNQVRTALIERTPTSIR
ncbi:endonuclease domain-containing protein [Lacisediminihabitans changchengi]|uniref:DUF559 domain-containing protein n=1 Tax=Lacisediminihabitans changchengi TaxID=2787634 RepID=A0A934SIC2_9MICO|nr:hypothetical protein [Lacisediminihabitans changchengi]MBK4347197.1 hypothetical protein [Lacisediminihabitans changchengi]